jgi:hypothetical protein
VRVAFRAPILFGAAIARLKAIRLVKKATVTRSIIAPPATISAYCSAAIEIQTKLQAVRMEGTAPVKGLLGAEIVPLNGDPDFVHVAVQGTPSIFHFTPGMLLGCATRIHFA